jgi:multidrug efflux system outer membrane protein
MTNTTMKYWVGIISLTLLFTGCTPTLIQKSVNRSVPEDFAGKQDSSNIAMQTWKEFFTDPMLQSLIDSALSNNQELNIMLQEITIANAEVSTRKGDYLPFLNLGADAGLDKTARYTRNGVVEANHEMKPGTEFPEPLGDLRLGASATWEVDIWKKLRNSKKAAVHRYLASMEGRNFMVTHLVSEIAEAYYELLALDNELLIINRNIQIQSDALATVKQQKLAGQVTELAVKRFEAQVLNTRSLAFNIKQQIVETENRINFLVGRYPTPIERSAQEFTTLVAPAITAGVPSQMLENRPDVRQAEQELAAADLDIKVAKANFYPSLDLSAGLGFQAFNPKFLISPESIALTIAGGLAAPLLNRYAIKANYISANARQIQVIYDYERTLLSAYVEVVNELSRINNLQQSFDLKAQQVDALTESVDISNKLFRSARADYMEVLLTQREALESKFELIETKSDQMKAIVRVYKALGGGWK